jgi:ubiquinone biosynthesis protein UbiJ
MTAAGSASTASAPRIALPLGLLAFVERELNRLVAESTAATELLERLQGSSFAVHVQGFGVTAVLHADGERLRVDTEAAGATATLRATPLDLLRLMNAEGVTGVKRTRADLRGDLQVAERFSQLLRLARPDLEDEVARWIGDVPAHALGEAARGAGAWLERAAEALRLNTAEYLQEESRTLPGELEAQAFYSDVERLRDDVERAAARLARLTRG